LLADFMHIDPNNADSLRRALQLPDSVHMGRVSLKHRDFDIALFAREPIPLQLSTAVPKRTREFLAGRYCARRALARAGVSGLSCLPMGKDRLPIWPDGWTGSISHSDGVAIAAVASRSDCYGLGIDVEQMIDRTHLETIAALIAQPDELSRLGAFAPALRQTLLFSAKETLYKALYPQVRRFFDFHAAHLQSAESDHLNLSLSCDWGESFPRGTIFPINYVVWDDAVYTAMCLTEVASA
jgi:enterobactin synthetase component D